MTEIYGIEKGGVTVAEKRTNGKKQLKIWLTVAFIAIFIGLMVFLFSGGNLQVLKNLFRNDITKEEVRNSLNSLSWRGYITVGVLSMLQVLFTFLPAEPVQVMAGISFGFWKGSLICIIGAAVGNSIIYLLYKIYGQRLTEYFEHNVEFDFDLARTSSKIALIILILYLLPAIPYGLICFFAASLNIKFPKYLFLTVIGTVPSVFIGVGIGDLAIASSWIVSIVALVVIVGLLLLLFKNKSKVFQLINGYMKKQTAKENTVKEANGFVLNTLLLGSRLLYDTKMKVRLKNNVGRLEKPAIVLCNHGSFIDFVYSARLLRREKPHFIAARLYFYNKKLNKLMRSLGTVPKSMFSADLENAKNCMKILANGGVLAMMPEARLSTVGKFEGIQDSTYKFIQRFNAAVYSIKLNGNYLAMPKWGDGARRGAHIEGELNLLFEKGEAKRLPFEEVKARIDHALGYDEFAWLAQNPEVEYKTKTLAEGLENILYRCPKCGGMYAFTAKERTLTCSHCGLQASIDSRYAFVDKQPFENFAKWYEWQNELTKSEILSDPDYALESRVELRHSSTDGKHLTRYAGEGYCRLDKRGLTYCGTEDGKEIERHFPLTQIYRLLFGAGEDFEIYDGREIWYFVPEEKRSCVIWYVVSTFLKQIYDSGNNN